MISGGFMNSSHVGCGNRILELFRPLIAIALCTGHPSADEQLRRTELGGYFRCSRGWDCRLYNILGTTNKNGTSRLELNYPGYNFNISDQRRVQEFIKDFDTMVNAGTLPQFLYIYEPSDHTGGVQTPNAASVVTSTALDS
jgi:hypothetical protein